jgi:hypothetical protein
MMTERGARYEIAIDGTTRTYLDREDIAQQAAARLKQINPNSKITLRDLQTGTVTVVTVLSATRAASAQSARALSDDTQKQIFGTRKQERDEHPP